MIEIAFPKTHPEFTNQNSLSSALLLFYSSVLFFVSFVSFVVQNPQPLLFQEHRALNNDLHEVPQSPLGLVLLSLELA